jgi:hypothetical protein
MRDKAVKPLGEPGLADVCHAEPAAAREPESAAEKRRERPALRLDFVQVRRPSPSASSGGDRATSMSDVETASDLCRRPVFSSR